MLKTCLMFFTFTFTFTLNASLKNYKLNLDLIIDGQSIAKPVLLLKEGQKNVFYQEHKGRKVKFEIVARESHINYQPAISIKFLINHTLPNGGSPILSDAEKVTMENRKSKIFFSNSTDHKKVILQVTALRETNIN